MLAARTAVTRSPFSNLHADSTSLFSYHKNNGRTAGFSTQAGRAKEKCLSQDGKVDRSGAHSGQKHGQQVAVNAERWPCAPAVQQRKLAQLRRDGGCHVPPLQAERIEQAAGRHLVIGRHGCRAEQRGVAAGERLTEKQLAQLRCQRSPTACAAVTAGSSAVQTELTNATGNSSSGMAMPEITPSADSACS